MLYIIGLITEDLHKPLNTLQNPYKNLFYFANILKFNIENIKKIYNFDKKRFLKNIFEYKFFFLQYIENNIKYFIKNIIL